MLPHPMPPNCYPKKKFKVKGYPSQQKKQAFYNLILPLNLYFPVHLTTLLNHSNTELLKRPCSLTHPCLCSHCYLFQECSFLISLPK